MALIYILILIMPLATHPLWGREVGGLTITKYLGGACLLYAVFHIAARRALPSYFRFSQMRWFLALHLLAAVSYLTQAMPRTAWEESPLLSYTSFLFLGFIALSTIDSYKRVRGALLAIVGSGGLASLYVLREWQKYHELYPGFRPGWVVGDANYFSLSALMCVAVAFCLMVERGPVIERLFCLGCLVLTLGATMVAASRGGFLGLVAAFLFIIWKSRQRARNLALAVALLLPFALLAPASPVSRLLHPTASDQEAVVNRTTVWEAGLRIVRAHPLRGIGLGNFKPMVPLYEEGTARVDSIAHNSYIEIAAETGLPGLFLFLGVLASSLRCLERLERRARESDMSPWLHAARGVQVALVGSAVSIFFISGQYEKTFWVMVFLSVCLASLQRASIREKEESSVTQEEHAISPPASWVSGNELEMGRGV